VVTVGLGRPVMILVCRSVSKWAPKIMARDLQIQAFVCSQPSSSTTVSLSTTWGRHEKSLAPLTCNTVNQLDDANEFHIRAFIVERWSWKISDVSDSQCLSQYSLNMCHRFFDLHSINRFHNNRKDTRHMARGASQA
jgi:hypothetical protein